MNNPTNSWLSLVIARTQQLRVGRMGHGNQTQPRASSDTLRPMRWLTLDFDGTLADWPYRYIVRPVMLPFLEQPAIRQALREEYKRRIEHDNPSLAFDWGDIHQTVRKQLNLEQSFPDVPSLLASASLPPEMLYADVPGALELFRSRGWGIAVATNGYARYQEVLVQKLGIPYDLMLAPDRINQTKPHPEFWQSVQGAEGSVVHVGDLLSQDIWGANNAGITAVWIWREMPPVWRATPLGERTQRADLEQVIAGILKSELEEHGFVGKSQPSHLPRPDLIIADLLELAEVL